MKRKDWRHKCTEDLPPFRQGRCCIRLLACKSCLAPSAKSRMLRLVSLVRKREIVGLLFKDMEKETCDNISVVGKYGIKTTECFEKCGSYLNL